VKFPKAVAKITDDADQLLAFFDYPAEHWVHLRTTDENVNPGAGRGQGWPADGWTAAAA
jgi:transposase-like protein